MLILTRRVGEKLMIGSDVILTIGGIKGRQVRLLIDAPQNISIDREEIYLKKNKARKTLTLKKEK